MWLILFYYLGLNNICVTMIRSHDIWKTIIIMNLVYDNYYSSNGFNIA